MRDGLRDAVMLSGAGGPLDNDQDERSHGEMWEDVANTLPALTHDARKVIGDIYEVERACIALCAAWDFFCQATGLAVVYNQYPPLDGDGNLLPDPALAALNPRLHEWCQT